MKNPKAPKPSDYKTPEAYQKALDNYLERATYNLGKKIELLNKACKNSLSICCFSDGWEIHSYQDGSPLCQELHYPHIKGKTITEVVDKAYEFVFNK